MYWRYRAYNKTMHAMPYIGPILYVITSIGDADSSASLSRYYGTEFYRSPEVRKKHHRSKIDWRKTDIYASGVIFFELCHIVPRQDRDKV